MEASDAPARRATRRQDGARDTPRRERAAEREGWPRTPTQRGVPLARGDSRPVSMPRRDVNALCAAVGVAGLASLVVAYLGPPPPSAAPPIFAFFLVVLAVTYVRPLRLWHDGQAENV